MDLYEDEGLLVFELSSEETNKFFEPFDPQDTAMSMMDWQNRKRYMLPEAREWFETMIGPMGDQWGHKLLDAETDTREIWFLEKRHAMMFKLTYHI